MEQRNDYQLSEVFDYLCPNFEVDKTLVKKIEQLLHSYINKNSDHSAFFGGNLLGVHVVKFDVNDLHNWFNNILDVDEEILQKAIYYCKDINSDFEVSSNAFNISCIWLCHKIANSNLDNNTKRSAMINVLIYLQIKFVTGRLYRLFPYPADIGLAEATYNSLSNKYAIKEHGNWFNFLKYRATETISPTNRSWKCILNFKDNYEVVIALNTAQGQVRSMMKFYRRAMEEVRLSGNKMKSVGSTMISADGDEILRDKNNGVQKYINYLKSIVTDSKSFIRGELISVVLKLLPNVSELRLKDALNHMGVNYYKADHLLYEQALELLVVYSLNYIQNSFSGSKNTDLASILLKLRGNFTASRSNDPDLNELRTLFEKLIAPSVNSKNSAIVSNVRTSVMLYTFARTYTMTHYQSN